MKKLTWPERYARMKSAMGWTNGDVAELLDKTAGTVGRQTAPKSDRKFPAWGKALVLMWERLGEEKTF